MGTQKGSKLTHTYTQTLGNRQKHRLEKTTYLNWNTTMPIHSLMKYTIVSPNSLSFLSSHISLTSVHTHTHMYMHTEVRVHIHHPQGYFSRCLSLFLSHLVSEPRQPLSPHLASSPFLLSWIASPPPLQMSEPTL